MLLDDCETAQIVTYRPVFVNKCYCDALYLPTRCQSTHKWEHLFFEVGSVEWGSSPDWANQPDTLNLATSVADIILNK